VATVSLLNPVLPNPAFAHRWQACGGQSQRLQGGNLYLQDLVTITPQWKALCGMTASSRKHMSDSRASRI
jgi:catecholate siderophore receptor